MSCHAEKRLLATLLLAAFVTHHPTNSYFLDPQIGCSFRDSINITDGHQEQGNYHHNGVVYGPQFFGTFDFVVINETAVAAEPHVRGCICAVKGTCVRVCCDPQREPCPTTFDGYLRKDTSEEPTYSDDLTKGMALVYGGLECQKYSINPQDDPFDNFTMLANGSLFLDVVYEKDHFCLGRFENVTIAQLCFGTEQKSLKFKIYPLGMLFSVPFLVITFLVYGLIPELRNLHGKNLMSYVLCLSVAYTTMAIIHLKTEDIATTHHQFCRWLGYVSYVAFVCSFFWLNVLCFDIWWTFRGVRGVARDLQRKKFILYSLYGWGGPLLIFTWVYLVDTYHWVPVEFRPQVGESTCFVSENKLVSFLYMYMIMLAQLISNITLFLCTSYQIQKLQQETKRMTNGGESRKFNRMEADRDRFSLYLRLFIVMGVTWLAEVISFALNLPEEYSYVTDVLNSLHGFFIFFLFVWKPKVRKLIVKRYQVLRGLPTTSSNGFRSSTMTTASNAYSRQSTMNGQQTVQLKSLKGPEAKLLSTTPTVITTEEESQKLDQS